MTKLILTDVDGVLLDWESAFHDWMEAKGFSRNSIPTYDMHVVYGQKKEHIKALVREFNNSAWMCCLQPLRDAVEGVAALAAKGYRFGAITSLSLDPYAAKLREENLRNVFGDVFDFVQCLDTGADKDEALAPWKDSGLFWLEDKKENAILGADLGLKSIIIKHHHNADFDDGRIAKADTWKEVVSIITSE
jgi:FMN phosphatase YigB (HAD superfamily)